MRSFQAARSARNCRGTESPNYVIRERRIRSGDIVSTRLAHNGSTPCQYDSAPKVTTAAPN